MLTLFVDGYMHTAFRFSLVGHSFEIIMLKAWFLWSGEVRENSEGQKSGNVKLQECKG